VSHPIEQQNDMQVCHIKVMKDRRNRSQHDITRLPMETTAELQEFANDFMDPSGVRTRHEHTLCRLKTSRPRPDLDDPVACRKYLNDADIWHKFDDRATQTVVVEICHSGIPIYPADIGEQFRREFAELQAGTSYEFGLKYGDIAVLVKIIGGGMPMDADWERLPAVLAYAEKNGYHGLRNWCIQHTA
jgi:hypothetical protein